MKNKPPCELCIKYSEKRGEEPDCAVCIPALHEENELAIGIFLRVQNQLLFHPSGKVLGLDLNVVLKILDQFGWDSQTLDKILFLEKKFILEK